METNTKIDRIGERKDNAGFVTPGKNSRMLWNLCSCTK